jgi:hypothetical protein
MTKSDRALLFENSWYVIGIALVMLAVMVTGCGAADDNTPPPAPACDTLRSVFVVKLCSETDPGSTLAQCKLFASAPAGAAATGCSVTAIGVPGGPASYDCVAVCP